jgi:hypothetical protein
VVERFVDGLERARRERRLVEKHHRVRASQPVRPLLARVAEHGVDLARRAELGTLVGGVLEVFEACANTRHRALTGETLRK